MATKIGGITGAWLNGMPISIAETVTIDAITISKTRRIGRDGGDHGYIETPRTGRVTLQVTNLIAEENTTFAALQALGTDGRNDVLVLAVSTGETHTFRNITLMETVNLDGIQQLKDITFEYPQYERSA